MGNWEDMALGGSLFVAVFASMALNNIKGPEIDIASPANASEQIIAPQAAPVVETPAISFTVTGKRLPKECKGVPATDAIDARCEALRDQTTVTVKSATE